MSTEDPQSNREDVRPLAAPCRDLEIRAPLRWLRAGWADYRHSLRVSFGYGLVIAGISFVVSALAFWIGRYVLLLAMMSGFIFIAPLLAAGMYSVCRQLERGEQPRFRQTLHRMAVTLGDAMVFALVLMVIFLVWARAASMVHIFFPMDDGEGWLGVVRFVAVGTVVGAIFGLFTFAAAAFSLPMVTDRKVDAITACITSINAVLRNKRAMGLWILLIVALLGAAFITAGLGLVVVIPWLGYASFHAYRETVDASAWPPADR